MGSKADTSLPMWNRSLEKEMPAEHVVTKN